jgi:hypothetical protein
LQIKRNPPDQPGLKPQPTILGDDTLLIHQQRRTLYLLLIACFISLLTGCASQRANSQFTVRVSGNTDGLAFDGQCTAQKARFWSGESVAQSLDIKGTVYSVGKPQDYRTSGYFIYCAVANQSANGTITVELLQDGNVVASAQSSAPDKPATLEFGQKP